MGQFSKWLLHEDQKEWFDYLFALVLNIVFLALTALLLWPLGEATVALRLAKGYWVFWTVVIAASIVMVLAQRIYARSCPDLRRRVCPGARMLLYRLSRRGIPTGLVTGNLTRIGWKKIERAGLKQYLRFGAFAELAPDRAGLVRIAVGRARREGWIDRASPIALIGDHPNDIRAARANSVRSIAVATGVVSAEELARHAPDVLVPDLRELSMEMLFG